MQFFRQIEILFKTLNFIWKKVKEHVENYFIEEVIRANLFFWTCITNTVPVLDSHNT